MQLFSQGLHLVEFTAVDVSSAHWNGRDGIVVIVVKTRDRETDRNSGITAPIQEITLFFVFINKNYKSLKLCFWPHDVQQI